MDMVAYWLYAFLQGIVVVTFLKVKDRHINVLALVVFTFIAPLVTAFIMYVFLNDFLDWLQVNSPSSGKKKTK